MKFPMKVNASTIVSPLAPDGAPGINGYSINALEPSKKSGNQSASCGSVSRDASRNILPVKSSKDQETDCR